MSETQQPKRGKKKYNENLNVDEDRILWKGRKCIMGLPISFTTYTVEEDRLIVRVGLFSSHVDELLLYRVLDLKYTRTFGQKLAGVGTVCLYTADKTDSVCVLKNIKKSEKVWRFLSNLVENKRAERRVTGREMYGVAGSANMVDIDGDGIPDVFEDGEQ